MTDLNPWAQIIGPCYTAASIARALGWTPDRVTAAVESLSLLELETDDNVLLYPAFQIDDGRIIEGISEVIRVLSTGTRSTWTWAQWLNSRVDDETGEEAASAIEQLRAGHIEDMLRDARHAAAAWSS
ncbi:MULTISPECIES: hypothetical protein [unclassified Microbacterium]|uniref:hypothetical protein n=1 Tax=unclassified Microbacterium TaxID=2609290 RepID=UPI0021A29DF5|nr:MULTISPECIES: hypothetical protein [unclassified Microbacterium]MCT1365048.1 hypothetical protein [Microbacterium sp. p3-SID131]MCT1377065.1 hypothetical protein [Microbacterium sp. p3-SID337]